VRVADKSYELRGEVGADAATSFELEAPGRPSSIVVDPRSLCWDKNLANNKWPDFRVPRREIFKSKARADGRESLADPERVKIHSPSGVHAGRVLKSTLARALRAELFRTRTCHPTGTPPRRCRIARGCDPSPGWRRFRSIQGFRGP